MPERRLEPGFEGVILDCRAGPERGGYDAGHLVGAIRVDLNDDLSEVGDPAVGGRHPLPPIETWAARLGRWGIGPDTVVAVVDGQGGGLYAARAWWMPRAVGHEAVFVVDGGYAAAVAAGFPETTEVPQPVDVGPYPVSSWQWPVVDLDEVDRRRTDPDWRVVDARSAARWRGEVEPIDPVPGRIEGSVNWAWEDTVDADGRLLPADALAAQLAAVADGVPDEQLIVHCGSGVTACQLVRALDALGRGPVPLYVGSWSEWCRQREV